MHFLGEGDNELIAFEQLFIINHYFPIEKNSINTTLKVNLQTLI